MDYEKIKEAIGPILEVVATVPEPFKQACFGILLRYYLDGERAANPQQPLLQPPPHPAPPPAPNEGIPLNAQMRVFMQRRNVTEAELNTVLHYEEGEVYFVKEPSTQIVLQGQNDWALLFALKNAILKNSLATDPEDVRSMCKAKGYYDPLNFAKYFKKKKYAAYFRNALEAQGEAQPLTNDGEIALAKLIHSLAGEPE